MVGVGQDNLSLRLILHIAMEDTLHRRCSTHRHKYRSLNDAVIRNDFSRTRVSHRISML